MTINACMHAQKDAWMDGNADGGGDDGDVACDNDDPGDGHGHLLL